MSRKPVRRTKRRDRTGTVLYLSPTAWLRLWKVIGWSATLAAAAWGLRSLEERVVAAHRTGEARLEWVGLPEWLTQPESAWILKGHSHAKGVEELAALAPDADPFDPLLCARLAANIAASPWVAAVERVTREREPDGDTVIHVAATFRTPLAFVVTNARAYLVDEAGHRLPVERAPDYLNPAEHYLIVGAKGTVPKLGQQWVGQDIAAGLKLAAFFRTAELRGRLPFREELRAIDVANFDRCQKISDAPLRVQLLDPRGYINWGDAPGAEDGVEPPAARKLEMLTDIYANRGRLPVQEIELRDPDPRGTTIKLGPARGG